MVESQQITPIFTPSTKAEQGEHDENITKEQADKIVGKELCDRIEKIAIDLYTKAETMLLLKVSLLPTQNLNLGWMVTKLFLLTKC